MRRYVIGPDAAIELARVNAVLDQQHALLAPAVIRSQVLSLLYQAERRSEVTWQDADRCLGYLRGLRMRL